MTVSSWGVNADEAVKLWSRKTMHEALKRTLASKFMGDGSDSLCQVHDDMQKASGDRVRTILRMQLTGAGIQGDNTLEGNEEALITFTDNVTIDQLRHAVRSGG
jgi:N4-gp56 family major capsid protein